MRYVTNDLLRAAKIMKFKSAFEKNTQIFCSLADFIHDIQTDDVSGNVDKAIAAGSKLKNYINSVERSDLAAEYMETTARKSDTEKRGALIEQLGQDVCERIDKLKKEKSNAKNNLEVWTLSMTHKSGIKNNDSKRDADLNGFICLDFDNLITDIEFTKKTLMSDRYIWACGLSTSGNGLWALIKPNAFDEKNFLEAFKAASEYFYEEYNLLIDQSCKNINRLRFRAYDPEVYFTDENKEVFRKRKAEPKLALKKVALPKTFISSNDLHGALDEALRMGYYLAGDFSYDSWLKMGFSLYAALGSDGNYFFHAFSKMDSRYKERQTEQQWKACVNNFSSNGNTVKCATVYYLLQQAGITINNKESLYVVNRVNSSLPKKKMNFDKFEDDQKREVAIELKQELFKEESVTIETITEAIEYADRRGSDVPVLDEDASPFDQIELLRNSWYPDWKICQLSKQHHIDGQIKSVSDLDSIFIRMAKAAQKVKKDAFYTYIESMEIPRFNPLTEMLIDASRVLMEKEHDEPTELTKILNSVRIKGETDKEGCPIREYKVIGISKWLLSIISNAHGNGEPLMLVFTGGKGKGKTHWFRHLLPTIGSFQQDWYTESNLSSSNEADDKMLMCKKWIICIDEFGSKTVKKEIEKLKSWSTAKHFSLRKPYGRGHETYGRIATLCGTSNNDTTIYDRGENRRILSMEVESIDHKVYNSVDKTLLFAELYQIYLNDGAACCKILDKEIQWLTEMTQDARIEDETEEMVNSLLIKPEFDGTEDLYFDSPKNIANFLSQKYNREKLSATWVKNAMLELGYTYERKRRKSPWFYGNQVTRGFYFCMIDESKIKRKFEKPIYRNKQDNDLPY